MRKFMATVVCAIMFLFSCAQSMKPISSQLKLQSQFWGRSLCEELIDPAGYACTEHIVKTDDGYLLALQHVYSHDRNIRLQNSRHVLLQHGLFMAGDAWFLNGPKQSLGFILASQGFDVWIANARGTFWSYGHVLLSEYSKEFWDWSWQDLALHDLPKLISYIHAATNSKVLLVGHSQGTIMSLALLTQANITQMIDAAALLCPISFLGHVDAPLVLRMVNMHLDQMVLGMGIHQLNFRNKILVGLLDSICDGQFECNNLLSSITGKNCCINDTQVDVYFKYEPHPSSTKNLHHLFQMIRKGKFTKYDYGMFKNLKKYGQPEPPIFNISLVPKSMPLWMAYGGQDALADLKDVDYMLREMQCAPELLYLENYGHVDFILSARAKQDVYDHLVHFLLSTCNAAKYQHGLSSCQFLSSL